MKGTRVILLIICLIGFICAGALYLVGKVYPTVGCIAPGDCLIPAITPLWVVAVGIAIFIILFAGGIALWSYKQTKH